MEAKCDFILSLSFFFSFLFLAFFFYLFRSFNGEFVDTCVQLGANAIQGNRVDLSCESRASVLQFPGEGALEGAAKPIRDVGDVTAAG